MSDLAEIQSAIKAPKSQYNSFGKYHYRNAEDILEAAKPVLLQYGYSLVINDEIVLIGQRYYVKSTVTITNGSNTFSATAFAREEESKKGMDGSQVTGASSSYARKYALNGLFAIDDTKDSDSTNTHDKIEKQATSNAKKPINEEAFNKLVQRLANGEDIWQKAADTYSFDSVQQKVFLSYKPQN